VGRKRGISMAGAALRGANTGTIIAIMRELVAVNRIKFMINISDMLKLKSLEFPVCSKKNIY
jgi:hypothetical protein